jgi:hypothetical protein
MSSMMLGRFYCSMWVDIISLSKLEIFVMASFHSTSGKPLFILLVLRRVVFSSSSQSIP